MNPRSIRFRMTSWYVAVLTICLAFFGASIYIGLGRYLISAARSTLREEAQALGESPLKEYDSKGVAYVIQEMNEDYAHGMKDRFLRVTLADGRELYRSGPSREHGFDPRQIEKDPKMEPGFHILKTPSGPVLLESIWYRSSSGTRFFIENGMPEASFHPVLVGLLWSLGLAFPVVVAGAAFGGYWIMRRSLRSVDQITREAERITSRNLSKRIPTIRSGDEIERLSTALNHMIGRLEGAFQHINRFSADASHELRTPLTIIRGELESLIRQPHSPAEMREILGSSLEEVDRLSRIAQDLLAIARLDAGEVLLERTVVDLGQLGTSTIEQMQVLAEEKSIELRLRADEKVIVSGDQQRLKQVIVNLVANAINYTPNGGRVNVRVSKSGSIAALEVLDNGIGISPEDLPHVFERFYTGNRSRSREDGGGTGLGLPIVKAICTAHEARISVESDPSHGTRMRVEFRLESSSLKNMQHPMTSRATSAKKDFEVVDQVPTHKEIHL